MSFADFGTGGGGAGWSHSSSGPQPASTTVEIPLHQAGALSSSPSGIDPTGTFRKLWDNVSNSIFQVSSNVATIQRLLNLFGSHRDTPEMRWQLHDVTERTRQLIKTTSLELKKIMAVRPSDGDRQIRITQKKLQKDFEEVLRRFQEASKIAAEKSRDYVTMARAQKMQTVVDEEGTEDEPLLGHSQQLSQLRALDEEVEFNEALITEREHDLVGIERSIQEVNEIFRDLGTLVNEQQYLLDNIETNVGAVAVNVEGAHTELRTASAYQARSRSFMCWAFIILLIISLVVLALMHPWTWGH
ncbi:hypothetical protein BASA50_006989 [Batrachochytrium salamandrivorans]|uniref:t-SNARE coiled-coil homology domain-containing protein n=1 Tax=Batrachochytrium salamandrivorans TaxID=1357716 RepID=A0ABQ8F890_9FUNG|nr:hypothetical protein BASA62_003393 [Batrachochytrium salamandrivorans]KAH6582457.1 hypothetical protein BASA60_001919 [Batrachochytrium salamandrivorans]KAH6586022.1 hypothetical protein BASA61_006662 [Batrachochytrium salamandrivorans]KAH6593933.1 hypothetical protein BASA50_006989 [Batrachochytrium salamandrivorans]KAH9270671.1 hypothetical protein BASA83_007280 [Batrachochytrium salamandrivorans]